MLVTDVFPCEDGHAQERSVLPQVLPTVGEKDLWIADRNFCTTGFLFGIATRKRGVSHPPAPSDLELRAVGRAPQDRPLSHGHALRAEDAADRMRKGKPMEVRRITIELKKPTRDGDTEIHLLTNLPAKVANARSVADLYLRRWTVEKAFQELDQALNGEIKTLGYPKAALLSFCVALLTYNVISVVKSGLAAVHGAGSCTRETISGYYLGRGTGRRLPRHDDCRSAGGVDAAFCLPDSGRIGPRPEDSGRQGSPRPLPQERPRSEETDVPSESTTNDIHMFLPLEFSLNVNNRKLMQC